MPIVGGGGGPVVVNVSLLAVAPTIADPEATFVGKATNYFNGMALMIGQVNDKTQLLPRTPLSHLPDPPQALTPSFAAAADTFVAAFPTLVTQVNTMIDALSLPCSHVTALPSTPSRGSDPINFATEATAFLAAMTTLRTELNAFITALNALNPSANQFSNTLLFFDSTTHTWDAT